MDQQETPKPLSRRTLRSQLLPLRARIRETRGWVQPVSQVALSRPASPSAEQAVRDTRDAVLAWIEAQSGRELPPGAWQGESFELTDVGAQRTEAVRFEDYWSARIDDADPDIARRNWVTEIGICGSEDRVLFATRLQAVTRGDEAPLALGVPEVVWDVATAGEFELDGHPISAQAWVVDSAAEVEDLVDLLCDPARKHAVCVLSLPLRSSDPADAALPVATVLRRVVGAAHVVVLTGSASFELTNRVGKTLSVFLGAVRTYKPGFGLDAMPLEHRLALPGSIQRWVGGPTKFIDVLVSGLLQAVVSGDDAEDVLPSHAAVKQLAVEHRREVETQRGASDAELLALALDENEALRNSLNEHDSLLELAERERDEARRDLHKARAHIEVLRARGGELDGGPAGPRRGVPREEFPEGFDDLEEWARRRLAGKVTLLPRAIRAARKSNFRDTLLAYRALALLRDFYVPMKRGGGESARRRYDAELRRLHLEDRPTFHGERGGEEGDAYVVRVNGRRRELDRHLKGSNSRDPRWGFRLYFYWDDEQEQVVVGSLPNHLDTRIT